MSGTGIGETGSQAIRDREEELASLGEGAGADHADYRVRINSIESGLDAGIATFEGEVQLEEFLNNEFISRITIMVTIEGEETMPIGDVEAQLLSEAFARLRAVAALDIERLESSLRQTRRDEDLAYSSN